MAYYRVCPNCGSNLDPGEKCDCQTEKPRYEPIIKRKPQHRTAAKVTAGTAAERYRMLAASGRKA